MQYRRAQKNSKLLNELIELFTQLPNHSVQQTGDGFHLQSYNAFNGKTEKWDATDLKSMSNQQLKDLIKQKRWSLTGNLVKQFFQSS